MNWLLYAMLAALSWALVNNLDKIIVSRFVKSPLGIVVIEGFVGFGIAVFFAGDLFSRPIPFHLFSICVLAGFLLYLFNFLYYKALEKSDPTIIAILMQTLPLFTFLWGILFFAESFSIRVYMGSLFIILGGILTILEKSNPTENRNMRTQKALLIMIPANLLLSVNYALQKYALSYVSERNVFVLARIGGLFFSFCFLLVPSVRKSIKAYLFTQKIKEWSFFLFIELFNLAGIYLITVAYSLGPISLVTTVTSIQPILVAILGTIIGMLFLRRSDAISGGLGGFRIPAIFLIAMGVYLLSI